MNRTSEAEVAVSLDIVDYYSTSKHRSLQFRILPISQSMGLKGGLWRRKEVNFAGFWGRVEIETERGILVFFL